MNYSHTLALVLMASSALAACTVRDGDETVPEDVTPPAISTQVLTLDTVQASEEDWGTFREYFAGQTRGAADLLSGTATILPGMQIHPPHRHAEEEFLMVIEGAGEWTVGEEVFAAEAGDMLYAAPWDSHGITNTGDEPLTFVFWKWNAEGLPVPVDPETSAQ